MNKRLSIDQCVTQMTQTEYLSFVDSLSTLWLIPPSASSAVVEEQEAKLKQEMSRRLVETQKKLSLQEAHNSKLE